MVIIFKYPPLLVPEVQALGDCFVEYYVIPYDCMDKPPELPKDFWVDYSGFPMFNCNSVAYAVKQTTVDYLMYHTEHLAIALPTCVFDLDKKKHQLVIPPKEAISFWKFLADEGNEKAIAIVEFLGDYAA